MMLPDFYLKQVLKNWGLNLKKIRSDIPVYGSPERVNLRFIIEEDNQNLYLLENISFVQQKHKEKIAQLLFNLKQEKLPFINPYLLNKNNRFLSKVYYNYPQENVCCRAPRMKSSPLLWQLSPFLKNFPLSRPQYLKDFWRGKQAALFLVKLKKIKIPNFISSEKIFSLSSYIQMLVRVIQKNNLSLYGKISPFVAYLEKNFFPKYPLLSNQFCHGDFHPLNILWKEKNIKAIIDWEFAGYKKEGYDVANMLGCLGSEDLNGLLDGFALGFIQTLQNNGFLSQKAWNILPDYILALRFAWLSEWLRRNDPEMIEQEIKYMTAFYKNKDKLKKYWKL